MVFSSTKTLAPEHSFQLAQAYFNSMKAQKESKDLWVRQMKRKVVIYDIVPLESITQAIANERR